MNSLALLYLMLSIGPIISVYGIQCYFCVGKKNSPRSGCLSGNLYKKWSVDCSKPYGGDKAPEYSLRSANIPESTTLFYPKDNCFWFENSTFVSRGCHEFGLDEDEPPCKPDGNGTMCICMEDLCNSCPGLKANNGVFFQILVVISTYIWITRFV